MSNRPGGTMHAAFVRSLLLIAVVAAVGCTQSTASIAELLVDPLSATIDMDQSQLFTATAEYDEGDAADVTAQVTWTSSDEEVASIDDDGLATPVGRGVTTITAVFGDLQGSAELTIEQEPVLVSCTVEPSSVTLTIGGTEQLVVMGHHDDGSTENVTDTAVFESSDRTVAIVDSQGEVEAIGTGESDIEASIDGLACSSATITVIDGPCTELTITADGSEVIVDHSFQLTATCAFGDDTIDENNQVEWSSSDAAIATVDYEGVAMGVSEGDTTITAVFTNSGGSTVVATFDLTVIPAALESISVSPVTATGLGVGDTQHFTATCVYEGGSSYDCTGDVSWASSDETVATISNADGTQGEFTCVGAGTTEITASMDGLTSNSAIFVVEIELLCVSIAVTPVDPTIPAGASIEFTATCTMSDGSIVTSPAGLTWESSNTSVATIDSTGEATGLSPGTTEITASVETDSGPMVSPVSVLTVTEAIVEAIAVTPNPLVICVGVSAPLMAIALMSDGTTLEVTAFGTWSTSDPTIATVSHVAGSEGEVDGLGMGTVEISIIYEDVTGSGSVVVTSGPHVMSIEISPDPLTLPNGTDGILTANVAWTDGTTTDETHWVTWESDDPTIATVSNDAGSEGRVTAHAVGSANVSATGGGLTSSAHVVVTDVVCDAVVVRPFSASVVADCPGIQLHATCLMSDGTTLDVTEDVSWASSNEWVATIDSDGLATGHFSGSTVITATFTRVDLSSCAGSADLTVLSGGLMMGITVEPDAPDDLAVGLTQSFIAWAHWSVGCPPLSEWTNMVVWESSDPTVATISNVPGTWGVATAVGAGTTEITATWGTLTSPPVLLTVIP